MSTLELVYSRDKCTAKLVFWAVFFNLFFIVIWQVFSIVCEEILTSLSCVIKLCDSVCLCM